MIKDRCLLVNVLTFWSVVKIMFRNHSYPLSCYRVIEPGKENGKHIHKCQIS